jgi:LysR family nitrogen assimilation transcriptional regulator
MKKIDFCMDIRQLKYFVCIADCGNFSKAAEQLHIAQPSLSQQVRNLEDDLGVELFTRHARGVNLTEAGRQFYDHAKRILLGVERAKDSVQNYVANPVGKIVVGLPTSAARNFSIPLIKTVQRSHPNLSVHIVEAMSGYLDEYVQSGRVDVALLYDSRAYSHVSWTESISEDLLLITSCRSALAKKRTIRFDEIFSYKLVLPGRPNILRGVIDTIVTDHDVDTDILDCDSLTAIVDLVKFENYQTIMPHFAFKKELLAGDMVAIRIVDPSPSWSLSVVVSDRTSNASGSSAVAICMAETISTLIKSGEWNAERRRTTEIGNVAHI